MCEVSIQKDLKGYDTQGYLHISEDFYRIGSKKL